MLCSWAYEGNGVGQCQMVMTTERVNQSIGTGLTMSPVSKIVQVSGCPENGLPPTVAPC